MCSVEEEKIIKTLFKRDEVTYDERLLKKI